MRSLYFRSSYFDSLHKSNCNLSNQTAISAIRLQSQQSDCNPSDQSANSAIRLQSQQSDCNPSWLQLDCTDWFELQNRTAILDCSRLHSDYTDYPSIALDCIWITQRERFNPWEMFWKYWHMAFIRLLGLLGFDCFRITWRLHQIALDYWDCT